MIKNKLILMRIGYIPFILLWNSCSPLEIHKLFSQSKPQERIFINKNSVLNKKEEAPDLEKSLTSDVKNQKIDIIPTERSFSIKEPKIQTVKQAKIISTLRGKGRSLNLKGVMDSLEDRLLRLDEGIFFSIDQEDRKMDIKFKISSYCSNLEDNKQYQSVKETDFRSSIHILELIPDELLLSGLHWWRGLNNSIICSIEFIATNSNKDLHYFSIPNIPIQSIEQHFLLYLADHSESVDQLSQENRIVRIDQMNNYFIKTSAANNVDKIDLKCALFNYELKVQNSDKYSLWEWSEYLHSIPLDQRTIQPCRFVSYYNDQRIGVSQIFPLVYPIQKFISIDVEQISPKSLYNDIRRSKRRIDNFANIIIKNHHNFPIQLMIPESDSTEAHLAFFKGLDLNVSYLPKGQSPKDIPYPVNGTLKAKDIGHFLKFNNRAKIQIFQDEDLPEKNGISTKSTEGAEMRWRQDKKLLIDLKPKASITINLSLHINRICEVEKRYSYVASVLKFKRFPIHLVLNGKDFDLAEKTKLDLVEWPTYTQSLFRAHRIDEKEHFGDIFYETDCDSRDNGYFSLSKRLNPPLIMRGDPTDVIFVEHKGSLNSLAEDTINEYIETEKQKIKKKEREERRRQKREKERIEKERQEALNRAQRRKREEEDRAFDLCRRGIIHC